MCRKNSSTKAVVETQYLEYSRKGGEVTAVTKLGREVMALSY